MEFPKNTYAFNTKTNQSLTQPQQYMQRLGSLHAICKRTARQGFERGFSTGGIMRTVLFVAAVGRFGLDFLDAQQAGLEALRDVKREMRGAA